jgi:hypothetical protein
MTTRLSNNDRNTQRRKGEEATPQERKEFATKVEERQPLHQEICKIPGVVSMKDSDNDFQSGNLFTKSIINCKDSVKRHPTATTQAKSLTRKETIYERKKTLLLHLPS